jgi:hypothetical protein
MLQLVPMMARSAQIISHQEEVAAITVAILNPVRQQRLHMKAQPLKECAGVLVVGDHLGRDFSQLQRAGERHDLRDKTLAEASRLPVRGGVDADLADPVRPSERIHMEAGVACQGARLARPGE